VESWESREIENSVSNSDVNGMRLCGNRFSGARSGAARTQIECRSAMNHREVGRDSEMTSAPVVEFGYHRD